MSEDPLMDELVRVAREEKAAEASRLDERWDRLAAGTATAEEIAELRALAEGSPEARASYEAFRPLGPEFRRRVVHALRELTTPTEARPTPLTRRPSRSRPWFLFGGLATAAVAVVIAVAVRVPPALPQYVVSEISGGSSSVRTGQPEELSVFAPGDPFVVAVRPETAVRRSGHIEGECFLAKDGVISRLPTTPEVDPSGAIRFSGQLSRDLSPGTWRLWVVVARPGRLPAPADLESLLAANPTGRSTWVAVRREIEIRAP